MGIDGEVDHYVMLGLPSGEEGAKLSEQEIKKAYRLKLELHPDKRRDDPNAHADFLKFRTSYKILMDTKGRHSFHQQMTKRRMTRKSQQPKRRHVGEREQAARAAFSAAKAAREMEEYIRRSDQQLIERIKRDAAASKAPPPPINKGGARAAAAAASTQCPCEYCRGDWFDREFGCNFDGFEAYQNSFLTKFRTV